MSFKSRYAIAVCAVALILPSSAFAASSSTSTGTLVGSVTCGDAAITPAANAVVAPVGVNIETHSDSVGRFTLSNVPAGQSFTIDAQTDQLGAVTSSRFDVVVQPGETLDIGNLDLAVCPTASTAAVAPDDQEMQQRDNPND